MNNIFCTQSPTFYSQQMTNTELIAYVGAITGIVGAITGIAGAVMGYLAYRRSNKQKAIDLRLDLFKALLDLLTECQETEALLLSAKKLRFAMTNRSRQVESSADEHWLDELNLDTKNLQILGLKTTELKIDNNVSKHSELESRIIMIHAMRSDVLALRKKYEKEIYKSEKDLDKARTYNDVWKTA